MGYRSDVSLGIAFPSREALVAFVTKVKLTDAMLPTEWQWYNVLEVGDDGAALLYAVFRDVKWYDNYEDVQCHTALLELAADDGLDTAFIRVGEEYGDVCVEIHMNADNIDLYDFFDVRREMIAPEGGEPLIQGEK